MFARCLLSFGGFPRDVASFCEFLRVFASFFFFASFVKFENKGRPKILKGAFPFSERLI